MCFRPEIYEQTRSHSLWKLRLRDAKVILLNCKGLYQQRIVSSQRLYGSRGTEDQVP
jgi:hypothetical protein